MSRQTGKVKFFDDKKGFGFIIPDDGSADIFFHRESLIKPLYMVERDNRLAFDVERSHKGDGRRAIKVERA